MKVTLQLPLRIAIRTALEASRDIIPSYLIRSLLFLPYTFFFRGVRRDAVVFELVWLVVRCLFVGVRGSHSSLSEPCYFSRKYVFNYRFKIQKSQHPYHRFGRILRS